MPAVSIYSIETGLISHVLVVDGPTEGLAPPGSAVIEGRFDCAGWRVALVDDGFGTLVPTPVPYEPPPQPLDRLKDGAVALVLIELEQLDARLARPVSEITLALALGSQPPVDAMAIATEVNARKAALRTFLAALQAAETHEAFAAVMAARP